jgi:hypothetical protein
METTINTLITKNYIFQEIIVYFFENYICMYYYFVNEKKYLGKRQILQIKK